MSNMSVNVAGVEWKNPVTVASGTFGSGAEYSEFVDLNRLGAIVNSSRGIICAYKQDKYKDMGITAENFADASRKAVEDMIEDISGALANR